MQDKKLQNIINKYSSVFYGVGKLKGHQVKLNIDSDVEPTAQGERRIPYHIREKVKQAAERLEAEGTIEKVPDDQPRPWVSPTFAVPKKGICVDMRQANQAIKRVRHDVSYDLNSAYHFPLSWILP